MVEPLGVLEPIGPPILEVKLFFKPIWRGCNVCDKCALTCVLSRPKHVVRDVAQVGADIQDLSTYGLTGCNRWWLVDWGSVGIRTIRLKASSWRAIKLSATTSPPIARVRGNGQRGFAEQQGVWGTSTRGGTWAPAVGGKMLTSRPRPQKMKMRVHMFFGIRCPISGSPCCAEPRARG